MSQPLRIVAADDDYDMREFYDEVIPRLGHEVAVAENGRRLVELCQVMRPDLIVTDIQMPEMDGIEAVRQVRGQRPVPVVLVSASEPAGVPGIASLGQDFVFLRKPVNPAGLEAAILRALRVSGGR